MRKTEGEWVMVDAGDVFRRAFSWLPAQFASQSDAPVGPRRFGSTEHLSMEAVAAFVAKRPAVFSAPQGQPVSILASADGLFEVIMEAKGRSVLVTGAARTDNGPGPEAACLLWGTAFRVG